MASVSLFQRGFYFRIRRSPLRILGDVISIIGLIIYSQMLYFYYKHQNAKEFNPYLLYVSIFMLVSSIALYAFMYFDMILNKKPIKAIPIERWFTTRPFHCIMIIVLFIISFIFAQIAAWPIFHIYGAVFLMLLFAFISQLTDYIPY